MYNGLYITATGPMTGKSAIALGAMQLLSRSMRKVAFFRPIINEPLWDDRDPDINLMLEYFKINSDYADTFAYTQREARQIINQGSRNLLMENIIQKYKKLLETYDFVLCVGTDFLGKDPVFEFELNAEIAANLGTPVILVTSGQKSTAEDIRESLQITMDSLAPYSLDVVATIINRRNLTQTELDELRTHFSTEDRKALIYSVPNEPTIGQPTMGDVKKGLDAEVLFGEDRLDALVDDYLIAAMHVNNVLHYIAKDQLIVTPGDRADVLLAAIASRLSSSTPDIAGVLLTGGIRPAKEVCEFIQGWTASPLPILLTKGHTYNTMLALQELIAPIEPGNLRKINTVLGLFEQHVNGKDIASRIVSKRSSRITPMMFEFELIERAKANKMRIVLAEGTEERILRATDILLRRGVADITLLGDVDEIRTKGSTLGLDLEKATLIDPVNSPKFDEYANTYYELRKKKGITPEQARDTMADSTYYATMMVKQDDADGMVSGAVNTTAHTIRPAFEFVKTKPGFSVVSSVFLMCLKDRVLVFGDCAVNPNPTAQQLAEIAIASAHTAEVFGIEPRVAMLSYSTGTSGKGADVDIVVEATKIAKEMAPGLALEGPLQYDAAIDPSVAKTKMPDSKVAGKATVFIFPDLNTGNNTYKAVQRAAGAVAIGPVLQGLNKPVNDLSRGCTVPDIVNTVAITAVQAAAEKAAGR
ncbi:MULTISPECIES: phosphate acetyltransferase [Desulfovibrio]|uniref:Phosphate acetyltransferase n=1 Tax=Desulfovibrio desulfuricans TaxID=876 RepID=A0AA94L1Q5_DESDE|nr:MULTISPECIES: phosphate acetyltransferase [Desulfovibrio]ATD82282.1 phosphate acetyltransferase [Desulfovibrio sp. G11]SFW29655.1 phosphate acetyltransferase [Desulfovibrio desulfuricans]SPD35048.1 phosphate acetyltransferase [Desulfovibrio sp. G11]